jgi:MoaA/NifB/PqqE/SkfB family radical SAM enzyme
MGKVLVKTPFNKVFYNDKYFLGFNMNTGFEVLSGINGNPDPFSLELPSLIDIGIMGYCHNKCKICYQGDIEEDHMDIAEFIKIIDQIKHHTNQVALGGRGDPNKHPQFEEFIMYAKYNKVVPNYTTSGKGLTDQEVELTKKYCGSVAVSSYNQDFTFRALDMFMNANMKTNVHYVYSQETYEDALKLLNGEDIWNGKVNLDKLNAVVFLLFKKRGRAEKLNELVPTYYQVSLLCQAIASNSKNLKFIPGMDACICNYFFDCISMDDYKKTVLDTCEAARASAYISSSMKMIPCSFCNPIYGVSLKDQTIKEVWDNSPIFQNARNALKEKRNCCIAGV